MPASRRCGRCGHASGSCPREPQFGGGEQSIDDHVVAAHAIVHQLGGVALRSDHEQGRHLALSDAAGEFDEHLLAVIEGAQRPPRCAVAGHLVAEIDTGEIDAARHRLRGLGLAVLAAQRDELVLRILPRHRCHIGRWRRAQLHVIGAPVGVDDEIGHQLGPRWLHEDMDLLGRANAALGIADDPAHCVASGDRTGADELLAGLKRDVGDLPRRGVDLIERAIDEGIDLHRVDEAVADGLDARCGIGLVDARGGIGRFRLGLAVLADGLQLTRQRERFGKLHHPDGRWRIGGLHSRHRIVVGNLRRRGVSGAPCQRRTGEQDSRQSGFAENRNYVDEQSREPALQGAALRSAGVIVQAPSTS